MWNVDFRIEENRTGVKVPWSANWYGRILSGVVGIIFGLSSAMAQLDSSKTTDPKPYPVRSGSSSPVEPITQGDGKPLLVSRTESPQDNEGLLGLIALGIFAGGLGFAKYLTERKIIEELKNTCKVSKN
ncbi:MAG: hypothetical protein NZT61_05270 [Deltaproteobacteria bacterium]|nr:hypothetical protein [Deltaproteobacteria bacterium]